MAFDRKDLGGASLVLASALSIQLGAALATTTFDTISPVSAAGLSYAFAALVLLVVQPPIRIASWDRQKWLDALALGITAACASSFFYLSLDRLPLGSAVTIEFLGPLGLAILSGRRRGVFLAAGLALAGVALVSGATPDADAAGVGFALLAGLGWGLYMVSSRRAGRHGYPGEGLTIALCVTTLACLLPWSPPSPASVQRRRRAAPGGGVDPRRPRPGRRLRPRDALPARTGGAERAAPLDRRCPL